MKARWWVVLPMAAGCGVEPPPVVVRPRAELPRVEATTAELVKEPVPLVLSEPPAEAEPMAQIVDRVQQIATAWSPKCNAAQSSMPTAQRAERCLGAAVVEIPLMSTSAAVEAICHGDEACRSETYAALALETPDSACWRSGGREDHASYGVRGDFACECRHITKVQGEMFLFCRRQRLTDDVVTDVVMYRHDGHGWALAFDEIALDFDLDAPQAVALQLWLVGDRLVVAGAGCNAPPPNTLLAEVCVAAGIYQLRDGRLQRDKALPQCVARLMPAHPKPVRRVPRSSGAMPWYLRPVPPPLSEPVGREVTCPWATGS